MPNNKEDFLAYLKEASEQVNKWPTWKKSGLTDAATSTQSSSSTVVRGHNAVKSGKPHVA
ncbi:MULTISPECIES: hypothetical protein [Serratia]|uniref:hypothetical protein n=1 Tax=Serratia marcescens TaxID=615 RepID=UPI0018D2CBD4|nr:hypothetical protein [Serratia marcescens]MBH1908760.1 hypothetical protein [Serratia marcescens]MBH2609257.1 hypothetical protein [Serratia marcescens]MDV2098193.1 hypothetical protein [Serratia marcescens]